MSNQDLPIIWYQMEKNLLAAMRLDERWPEELGDANIFPTWDGRAPPIRVRGTTEGLSEAFLMPDGVFPFLTLQALQIWDAGTPETEPNRVPLVVVLQGLIGDSAKNGTRMVHDKIAYQINLILRDARKMLPQVEGVDNWQFAPGPMLTVPISDEPRVAGWVSQFRLTLFGHQIGG